MFLPFLSALFRAVSPAGARLLAGLLAAVAVAAPSRQAHEINVSPTITYSAGQPAGSADAVANWTGAADCFVGVAVCVSSKPGRGLFERIHVAAPGSRN